MPPCSPHPAACDVGSGNLSDAGCKGDPNGPRRLRDFPSRVGVYFPLATCLFPEVGYRLVWDRLAVGLAGVPVVRPAAKALRDRRRRLGSAPVKALFDVLAGPLGGTWTSPVSSPGSPGTARPSGPGPPASDSCASR
ncbi:transposase domain-containing protein [Streptomyces lavendulae]|uniref:transposase domain-containing protein n=1 Tax=Streptomyces lavendulae TaxID=1914 RepID=UPI003CD068D2